MGAMIGHDHELTTAENYRRFARRHLEAAGRSPVYEALAEAVADDEDILGFLGRRSAAKRQPTSSAMASPPERPAASTP